MLLVLDPVYPQTEVLEYNKVAFLTISQILNKEPQKYPSCKN